MEPLGQSQYAPTDQPWFEKGTFLVPLWLAAGALMAAMSAHLPLDRTQEARVLQTAREMLSSPLQDWLVPHLNGRVRLEKPPLAYWLAAGSYKALGVSVWAGRLPMALLGWLSLALTYALTRQLFNSRAAFFSAAAMLGSLLFVRYAPLAETDVLVTFFVTAAVYSIYRAWLALPPEDPLTDKNAPRTTPLPVYLHCHLAAAATALAILSKGPPGAYPILFLTALAAGTRRWQLLSSFLVGGAGLTLLAIAAPWFLYVSHAVGPATMKAEAAILLTGVDHKRPFWFYIAEILPTAPLPWIGFLLLGLFAALPQIKSSLPLRVLFLWITVIFLPLHCIGQKQAHYFLPLMPPLMALVGYAIDRAIAATNPRFTRLTAVVVFCTAIVALLAAPAPPIAAFMIRGHLTTFDLLLGAAMAASMAIVLRLSLRNHLPTAALLLILPGATIVCIALGLWGPTIQKTVRLNLARQIHAAFPNRPLAFWQAESLTLSYHLGKPVPLYTTERQLADALRDRPDLIVIFDKGKKKNSPEPPGMTEQIRADDDGNPITVYTLTSPMSLATQPSSHQ